MIDPDNVPDVGIDETVARYILQRSHIRSSNQTVKQDAFIPNQNQELSVTRHLLASDEELWAIGESVASSTCKSLYGRGDVRTSQVAAVSSMCVAERLVVRAAPISGNPNHADILGWPADKPAQKAIAQELAAVAQYVPKDTAPDQAAG